MLVEPIFQIVVEDIASDDVVVDRLRSLRAVHPEDHAVSISKAGVVGDHAGAAAVPELNAYARVVEGDIVLDHTVRFLSVDAVDLITAGDGRRRADIVDEVGQGALIEGSAAHHDAASGIATVGAHIVDAIADRAFISSHTVDSGIGAAAA